MRSPWWIPLIVGTLSLGVACAGKSEAPQSDPGAHSEQGFNVTAAPASASAEPVAKVDPNAPLPPLPAEADARVAVDKSTIVFDDGDSFAIGDEQIRVLGIDTPEITHVEHGIPIDQPYGREAATFTEALLKGATLIEYMPVDKDPYGRSLSHVFVDGELLSVKVLRAGLAVQNVSRYGDNGTPEIAAYILKASEGLPPVPFQDPHDWRRANQKR